MKAVKKKKELFTSAGQDEKRSLTPRGERQQHKS
jgi:hypothetical protein